MDGLGNQLLAGPALSQNEDIHIQRGGMGNQRQHLRNAPAAADNSTSLPDSAQAQHPFDNLLDFHWVGIGRQGPDGMLKIGGGNVRQNFVLTDYDQVRIGLHGKEFAYDMFKTWIIPGIENKQRGFAQGNSRQGL